MKLTPASVQAGHRRRENGHPDRTHCREVPKALFDQRRAWLQTHSARITVRSGAIAASLTLNGALLQRVKRGHA
jgi:hypothetical protein